MIEQRGLQEDLDRDDITTMVVETAAEMRVAWDKKKTNKRWSRIHKGLNGKRLSNEYKMPG